MSFSFGAQPASAGFGGGFGQPATSTPFGQQPAATSTPFGQPATSTPFGQQPAATASPFGQPQQQPQQQQASPFGQQANTGFGQPAATSTPFGQTVTPAPFGQSATGFGQQPAATGFGQTTTASPFGQPTTTAAPSTGFSFNSTFAPKPATTTFGTNNTSLFGANKTTGVGGFGTNPNLQQQQQQQRDQQIYQLLAQVDEESRKASAPSITSDNYEPENVWHALALLKSWWDPKSPNCRFKHYFYNVVPANEVPLYQRPADHDEAKWNEAQKLNPDKTT